MMRYTASNGTYSVFVDGRLALLYCDSRNSAMLVDISSTIMSQWKTKARGEIFNIVECMA